MLSRVLTALHTPVQLRGLSEPGGAGARSSAPPRFLPRPPHLLPLSLAQRRSRWTTRSPSVPRTTRPSASRPRAPSSPPTARCSPTCSRSRRARRRQSMAPSTSPSTRSRSCRSCASSTSRTSRARRCRSSRTRTGPSSPSSPTSTTRPSPRRWRSLSAGPSYQPNLRREHELTLSIAPRRKWNSVDDPDDDDEPNRAAAFKTAATLGHAPLTKAFLFDLLEKATTKGEVNSALRGRRPQFVRRSPSRSSALNAFQPSPS